MYRELTVWAALSVGLLASLPGNAPPSKADRPNRVTAIDILIDPDATMVTKAEAANARLRASFPEGFALDEANPPVIACLQRHVRTPDLDQVYGAIGKVLVDERPGAWKLKAYTYSYMPWKDLGFGRIVIEQSNEFVRFQQKLVDAVEPFTQNVETDGSAGADSEFNPHVTIGLAPQDYLKKMLDEKFEAFTFSPAVLSVYQLADGGNTRKKLKSWELMP